MLEGGKSDEKALGVFSAGILCVAIVCPRYAQPSFVKSGERHDPWNGF